MTPNGTPHQSTVLLQARTRETYPNLHWFVPLGRPPAGHEPPNAVGRVHQRHVVAGLDQRVGGAEPRPPRANNHNPFISRQGRAERLHDGRREGLCGAGRHDRDDRDDQRDGGRCVQWHRRGGAERHDRGGIRKARGWRSIRAPRGGSHPLAADGGADGRSASGRHHPTRPQRQGRRQARKGRHHDIW